MQARRLKTREQFQAVLASAPLSRTEHFVMHCMDTQASGTQAVPASAFAAGGLWFGAMVPKRWARRAVTRNLIKRQIYNQAARHAPALPVAAYLIRLRSSFDRLQFKSAASEPLRAAVGAEIEQLFRKAARAAGTMA